MENMGKQRLVNKAISPAEIVKAMMAGSITTAQAQAMYNGVIPIGDNKGIAAIYDIDKQVIQPLIWAEKQWTLDLVDHRNGWVRVTVPDDADSGDLITGTIVVPPGQVWYLCAHEILINQAAGIDVDTLLIVNFLVSSFPKTLAGTDKPYYDNERILSALGAVIDVGDVTDHKLIPVGSHIEDIGPPIEMAIDYAGVLRDFREWDELNTELRLVGGDMLTLTVLVGGVTPPVVEVDVELRVWGRVGKLFVS